MTPNADQIKAARVVAGLSQTVAAELIYSTLRTWQDWEAGKAKMHAGLWELFNMKTKHRPTAQLASDQPAALAAQQKNGGD